MDKVFLTINNFAKSNLVTIMVEYDWYSVRIDMSRDNHTQRVRLSNYELEHTNADVVIEITLNNMLEEINKYY